MQLQYTHRLPSVRLRGVLAISIGVALGCGLVHLVPQPAQAQSSQSVQPQTGPAILSASTEDAIALAKHLTQIKARFFGAWWCKYCTAQKELFGREAITEIQYIECDPRGKNPQRDLCIASQVPAFPTWEIQGNRYTGVRTLEQLANISGYAGSRNFE